MALFSYQTVRCNMCGCQFCTNFQTYDGRVCGKECKDALERLKVLSLMDKPYDAEFVWKERFKDG